MTTSYFRYMVREGSYYYYKVDNDMVYSFSYGTKNSWFNIGNIRYLDLSKLEPISEGDIMLEML